jgi:hypothetical protein
MGKKTLLLGAGFSYELGMPLANDLSKDFYCKFNPAIMARFINLLKRNEPYGKDRPINKDILDKAGILYSQFHKNGTNYEKMILEYESLKDQNNSNTSISDTYHYYIGIIQFLLCQILWEHQEKKYDSFLEYQYLYNDLSDFLNNGDEVYVFTLNHDICFEMLCLDMKLPFSFGTDKSKEYYRTNLNPKEKVYFSYLERENILNQENSFANGKTCFNIIKLHGAFNEFNFEDNKKIAYIDHKGCKTSGDYLESVKSAWNDTHYYLNGHDIKMMEFIPVTDNNGEFQIVARSVMIGGKKYSTTIKPKDGEDKLQLFDKILNKTDELTIIGYGFGDKHINTRIYNSMIKNENLKIKRIDPNNFKIPELFEPLDYDQRFTGGICTAAQWLHYRRAKNWDYDSLNKAKDFLSKRQEFDDNFRKHNIRI